MHTHYIVIDHVTHQYLSLGSRSPVTHRAGDCLQGNIHKARLFTTKAAASRYANTVVMLREFDVIPVDVKITINTNSHDPICA